MKPTFLKSKMSFIFKYVQVCQLVMSSIVGIDSWYRYRYLYLGIERGIDTINRYRDEVSKSIDS